MENATTGGRIQLECFNNLLQYCFLYIILHRNAFSVYLLKRSRPKYNNVTRGVSAVVCKTKRKCMVYTYVIYLIKKCVITVNSRHFFFFFLSTYLSNLKIEINLEFN